MVELLVRDEGPGVSPDVRARLFEPFSKSAERAAGTVSGVGLGLALSRSLARAMGGNLRLAGSTGGACFVLSLRRA
jgi:C4-dicarboxylate-specific signal transduction histidine kinase